MADHLSVNSMSTTSFPDPNVVVLIARVEFRRTVRDVFDWSFRSMMLVTVVPLMMLGFGAMLGLAGYLAGPELLGDGDALEFAYAFVNGGILTVAFFVGMRVLSVRGRIDEEAALLTVRPHAEVFQALVLAESARVLVFLAPLVTPGIVGFGLGLGSATVVVGSVAICVLAVLLGTALGYCLGLVAKNLLARSRLLATYRTALGGLFTVGIFGANVWFVGDFERYWILADLLAVSPTGWIADLAFVGTLESADVVAGTTGMVATVLGLVGLVIGGTELADRLWFVDPVQPEEASGGTSGLPDPLTVLPVGRPTAHVALKSWKRARRAPVTLQFAVLPLFSLVGTVPVVLRSGTVPAWAPPALAVAVAWSTGALFTLNPIGGEGSVLPAVLCSGTEGRQFVGGLVLAALVPGVPATVALVVASALVAGLPTGSTIGWSAVAVLLAVSAPPIAAVVGSAFPKSEATSIGRGREAVVPSPWAYFGYSMLLGVVALPALVLGATPLPGVLAAVLEVSALAVRLVAIGTTTLLAVAAGSVGYWLAVRWFDRYHIG